MVRTHCCYARKSATKTRKRTEHHNYHTFRSRMQRLMSLTNWIQQPESLSQPSTCQKPTNCRHVSHKWAALDAYLKAFRFLVEGSCNAGIHFAQQKTDPRKSFPTEKGSLPEIFSKESCLALWAARVLSNSFWESRISGAATRRTKEVTEDCHRGGQLLPM